ncbi:DUF2884 domain-containing protein [Candidatus Erwinia dacicola]|uniref:DUF2884 domain-containing protein n=1 Tax=Candidatus Erwinia dacicola TaxID=252393 RepID=A0A1E7Z351_9GAMM|nr:DUF2884 domain-containing protein [Candidatus Erwinia dacicola]NJC99502.1 DUF2884 family protein [Candidatus Erwinia dacicola]NJD84819.1 DUF2884 family protein [Candidatus Erwinia dacicola]OFC63192.1 hypothetical protein BBW68_06375 [Candidatus Erwinia dacicola]RAP71317.1 hypothetical protein ACZ87_01869 [Candidatus Erwinia dacicola]
MRKALFSGALLLLVTGQAQADYRCSMNPRDDIIISPNLVKVVGASGKLAISPVGDVQRNGKVVDVDAATRQKAIDYQNALRRDLPLIDRGAQQRLEKGRVALDRVVVEKLGKNSNVRKRLTTLDGQLKQQMDRIIEHRSDGLTFHHQAVNQVRQDGEQLVQNALGGVVQDSLNEMGGKQTSSDNPLQTIMGNLGGLQQAIQAEWSNQEQDFQNFGHEVCNRVTTLEGQRKALIAALK